MSDTNQQRERCVCGEAIVSFTFDGSRGICDLRRERVECPLTLECLNGHRFELWMTHDEARPYFEQTIAVGR